MFSNFLDNQQFYTECTEHFFVVQIFLKMLRAYYNHVRSFENTLVTKFFGLHCVKLAGANQKKVRTYKIFGFMLHLLGKLVMYA